MDAYKIVKNIEDGDIESIFIGRNKEVEFIKSKFDCVFEGKGTSVLITGERGIGKTFLVENIITELEGTNLTYVYEKAREYAGNPFYIISGIMKQLIMNLLTLPLEQLEPIKKALANDVNFNSNLVVSICPYAEKFLGSHDIIKNIKYDDSKYVIRKSVNEFMAIVSEYLFPLIIFIDDIQWSDNASLDIVKSINNNSEFTNVMVIASIRETNVLKIKKMVKNLGCDKNNVLSLNEFLKDDIKEYIEGIFGKNIENIDYLVRFIFGVTLGNPFYIKEIIGIFLQENIVQYDAKTRKWIVFINNINDITIPDDIEKIILNKLDKLNDIDNKLLKYISCFDGSVEAETLDKIVDIGNIDLKKHLDNLCDLTFLVKKVEEFQENEIINYSFAHDIIYELIYEEIEEAEKRKIHNEIAVKCLKYDSKCNKFFLISQLIRADYEMLTKVNTSDWIDKLYICAIETKNISNVESALEILNLCDYLLPYADESTINNYKFEINLEITECEFLCKNYSNSDERFKLMLNQFKETNEQIRIKKVYIEFYNYKGEFRNAFSIGIECLKKMKFSLNYKLILLDLIEMKIRYSKKRILKLKNSEKIMDKRIINILDTLALILPAAMSINEKYYRQIFVKIANLTAKYGTSRYSLVGYLVTSFINYNFWQDYEKGLWLDSLSREVMDEMDEMDEMPVKVMSYMFLGGFINHMANPLSDSIYYLEEAITEGAKRNSIMLSSYSLSILILTYIIVGKPFEEIENSINFRKSLLNKIGDKEYELINYVINKHIYYLKTGIILYKYQIPTEVTESEIVEKVIISFFRLQRQCLEGDFEIKYELIEIIENNLNYLIGFVIYYEVLFYLIVAKILMKTDVSNENKNKKNIDKLMKKFEKHINNYKYNFYSHYLILQAIYSDKFENRINFEKNINEAILISRERNYLNVEGFANLIAAKYYKNNQKLKKYYALEAKQAFNKLGATYIEEVIEKEFNLEEIRQNKVEHEVEKIIENTAIEENFTSLNGIEGMNEEESFKYVLNYLAEKYDVEYCAVLFEKSNEMHLKYEKKKDKQPSMNKEPLIMKHVSYLSRKIIRYVARTGEEISLIRNNNIGIFSKDLYILGKDELSIKCIPIKYFGVFIGLVYMEKENNDGFDEKAIEFIKSISPILLSKIEVIKNVNVKKIFLREEVESLLTEREIEVLSLVAEGMSNSAISKELFIALGTVKNHLSNIYSKLEVDSRIKAVIKANEMNIISV